MEGRDLLRELKRTVDELAVLHEIGKAITSTLDVREVLRIMLAKVSELLRPHNWSLLMVDEKTGELVFEVVVGEGSESIKGLRVGVGEGIAGWVAREQQPLLVADVHADARFAGRFDAVSQFQTHSILCVPLISKGKTLGVVELVNGPADGAFTHGDLKTLAAVADYAAIAMENAQNFQRVQELTVVDDHTQLFNSRHLRRVLEAEVARAKRFGHPLSMIFFDLDRFKTVNDTHGHQSGSALLAEVGRLLLGSLRSVDVPTRYGGDEFAILLPETDRQAALNAARRFRKALREHTFLVDRGLSVRLTASYGVATFPDDASDEEQLIRQSDLAMYKVKESGRDGIAQSHGVYGPPEMDLTPAPPAAA